MVRVLAQDDGLHIVEGGQVESLEDVLAGRVNRLSGRLLLVEETCQAGEVRLFEFVRKCLFPTLFDPYVHKNIQPPVTGRLMQSHVPGRTASTKIRNYWKIKAITSSIVFT